MEEERKTVFKLVDEDVDGCGTDISVCIEVNGQPSKDTMEKMQAAVSAYKEEYYGEWDSDGCFEAAVQSLKESGYEVSYLSSPVEIVL